MLPQEIIRCKRDKKELTSEQIFEFIAGIGNKSVSDVQVAAFTMAVLLNGLNNRETVDLTLINRLSTNIQAAVSEIK